jgi:hypothetical protein
MHGLKGVGTRATGTLCSESKKIRNHKSANETFPHVCMHVCMCVLLYLCVPVCLCVVMYVCMCHGHGHGHDIFILATHPKGT